MILNKNMLTLMGYRCFIKDLFILATIIIAIFPVNSQAETVAHRYKPSCALYAFEKIYCTGGQREMDSYFNDTFLLDLSSLITGNSNTTLYDLSTKWQPVRTLDYLLENRKAMAFIATNTSMLFFGGLNINTRLINISNVFHMDTESWETLPSYKDYAGEEKQISSSSATYSSLNNKVYLYGGKTRFPGGHTYQSLDSMFTATTVFETSSKIPTDGFGFAQSVTYNITSKSWSTTSPQLQPPTDSLRQLSFLDQNTDTIFYFGGQYATAADNYREDNPGSFREATTFNLSTGAWGKVLFGGQVPGYRLAPSLTVLSSHDILLYGGAPDERRYNRTLIPDFCYTLNLLSMNWTRHDLDLPYGSTSLVSRDSHAAILVETPESASVFIMFGLHLITPLNDILILDVKYIDKLRFVSTYPYIDQKMLLVKSLSDGTKLPSSAIIGIAVGGACLLLAAIMGCIVYRKRNKTHKRASPFNERLEVSPQISKLYIDHELADTQYDQKNETHRCNEYESPAYPRKSSVMNQKNQNTNHPPSDVTQRFFPHTDNTTNNSSAYNRIGSFQSAQTVTSTHRLYPFRESVDLDESRNHLIHHTKAMYLKPDTGDDTK